jgi:hypothetical protein
MFRRAAAEPASTQASANRAPRAPWTLSLVLGMSLGACSSDVPDPGAGSGGNVSSGGSPGTAGMSASAGATSTSGAGGAAAGGATGGGGATTAGGTAGASGAAGGLGAMVGGAAGAAGAMTAGSGGTAGTAGAAGAGSGTCQKGTTMGKEVLFIGESFVAASSIPEETTKLARAAGSLTANDSYVDKSVSGTWIGNGAANSIPRQYTDNSNGVRFVLMNGGGNDCWQGGQESHRTAALSAAKKLFQDMGAKGVKKVVYFFYPDPIGSQYGNLKACLDLLRPAMKALCDEQTSPKCHWVDLRETWNGHPEYTTDGIHVAAPGNAPTAAAIFKSMVDNCVAP